MGREEVYIRIWWENVRERKHMEDSGIDGRVILNRVGCGGMDWIELAQGRDRWRALVNAVMNLPFPKMQVIS